MMPARSSCIGVRKEGERAPFIGGLMPGRAGGVISCLSANPGDARTDGAHIAISANGYQGSPGFYRSISK